MSNRPSGRATAPLQNTTFDTSPTRSSPTGAIRYPPGRRVAHAVSDVQPAARRLQRRGSLTVLGFLDRVVALVVDDLFVADLGVLDRRRQRPADAAARARFDESVL